MKTLVKNTQEQINELLNCGNSKEIAEGKGMQNVLNSFKKELKNKVVISKKDFQCIMDNSCNIDKIFEEIYNNEGIEKAIKYLKQIS